MGGALLLSARFALGRPWPNNFQDPGAVLQARIAHPNGGGPCFDVRCGSGLEDPGYPQSATRVNAANNGLLPRLVNAGSVTSFKKIIWPAVVACGLGNSQVSRRSKAFWLKDRCAGALVRSNFVRHAELPLVVFEIRAVAGDLVG